MRNIRVLYVIDSLWGLGGAEIALLKLVKNLPADFDCRVITFHASESTSSFLAQFPCPVYYWPLKNAWNWNALRIAWRLRRFIRQEHIDIVHTFFPNGGFVGRAHCKIERC